MTGRTEYGSHMPGETVYITIQRKTLFGIFLFLFLVMLNISKVYQIETFFLYLWTMALQVGNGCLI